MIKIIIIGAGGLGIEILDTLIQINHIKKKYDILGFIDNNLKKDSIINNHKVLGNDNELKKYKGTSLVIGVGNPLLRKKIYECNCESFDFPVIVHPTAIVSQYSKIEDGTVIQAFCLIASKTKIGFGTLINARSGLGHHSQIGNFCSIQSFCDITGENSVGDLCFFGTGCKVIPKLTIGKESYICAGSIIFNNISEKSKVIGNPGKVIKVYD